MITKRLLILVLVVTGGLASIFALPRPTGSQPLGIRMELPWIVGDWLGEDLDVSQKEIDTLGEGTTFARKVYRNGAKYQIMASIVLSGDDMSMSIHRPERCLPAQGFTVLDSRKTRIPVPNHGTFTATRLHNVRNQAVEAGQMAWKYNTTYYWFVGHTDMTASHIGRTFIDMKDRLLGGYNQRWAYIMITGPLPNETETNPEVAKQCEAWIRDFAQALAPKIIENGVPYR